MAWDVVNRGLILNRIAAREGLRDEHEEDLRTARCRGHRGTLRAREAHPPPRAANVQAPTGRGIAIPTDARRELTRFWRAHPDLRKGCLDKYGFDPIDEEVAYWRFGLAEPGRREARPARGAAGWRSVLTTARQALGDRGAEGRESPIISVTVDAHTAEMDLDGQIDGFQIGIQYLGKARRTFDGRWRCLANVGGALCLVEVTVRPTVHIDGDPGDEDDHARLGQDLAYGGAATIGSSR